MDTIVLGNRHAVVAGHPRASVAAEGKSDFAKLTGQPAELSAWAYVYRADLPVQEKPEAGFILRRLERLDQVYRPVCLWLSQESEKQALADAAIRIALSPKGGKGRSDAAAAQRSATVGVAMGRAHAVQSLGTELAKERSTVPQRGSVEVRVYPSPYGWFGWQKDQQVTVPPEISADGGHTWVYRGNWNDVDMVAVFVRPGDEAAKHDAKEQANCAVPQIRAYGPEKWERMDVEIEWGFKAGTEKAIFDGRVEGFFGLVGNVAPLTGDTGTTMERTGCVEIAGRRRRAGAASPCRCCISGRPSSRSTTLPKFPYGHPRDTRITVWTQSGSFTFLARDLEDGPDPRAGIRLLCDQGGQRQDRPRICRRNWRPRTVKSIREMTREHREATWEEAMREIALPLLPPGTTLPPYKQVAIRPCRWRCRSRVGRTAWRMGASQLRQGELTYMNLALEAPRPIHDMDLAGTARYRGHVVGEPSWRGPAPQATAIFSDGSGNFCTGKLFHDMAIIDVPGYSTYELVHNGGTGRILYDLAEHYFLTGDAKWFKKNQWRMQAAAEWIIRQRTLYMKDIPNRRESLGGRTSSAATYRRLCLGVKRMEMVCEYRRLVLPGTAAVCRGHGGS